MWPFDSGSKSEKETSILQNSDSAGYVINLDYPINPKPRPLNPKLQSLINKNREQYKNLLYSFLKYTEEVIQVPLISSAPIEPFWNNSWFPSMDALSLYCLLSMRNPKRYIETGSGESTKFARRAIDDQLLKTNITSIDPSPRRDIDSICDMCYRNPLEDLDISIFEELSSGDILFVDNSHRVFMNSDSTVVFLEILPTLKPGVLIGFHDIYLPWDYPIELASRYYSEQYLLAAYLLAGSPMIEVRFPAHFVTCDPELREILAPLWLRIGPAETHGCSFWIETRD